MAQRKRRVVECDRCANPTKAVTTEKFSSQGVNYEIDLCERHGDMLYRDLSVWARMARELPPIPSSGLKESKEDWRRLHRVEAELGVSNVAPSIDLTAEVDEPEELPELLAKWEFTASAIETQHRQGFTDREIVEAAAAPEKVTPHPSIDSLRIHHRGRLRVTVNIDESTIVTVASKDRATPELDRKARVNAGWTLTQHAMERRDLRGFTDQEILKAATDPEVVEHTQGRTINRHGRLAAVVNVRTREVITVLFRHDADHAEHLASELGLIPSENKESVTA